MSRLRTPLARFQTATAPLRPSGEFRTGTRPTIAAPGCAATIILHRRRGCSGPEVLSEWTGRVPRFRRVAAQFAILGGASVLASRLVRSFLFLFGIAHGP